MTAPAFDIADAIADAVNAAVPAPVDESPAEKLEESPEEAPETVPTDDEGPEASGESEEGEVTEEEGDEALALPEGFVVLPSVTEGLATEFKLLDDEGEVEVPALMVEYKANGKVRRDRLDQVVKLAQWGVYSEDREQRLKQETQSQVQELSQVLAEREAQMERLLADEEYRERVYEAYLTEQSPEKRAERAEQAVTDLRLAHELQTISQSGEQFYTSEVDPALRLIAGTLPSITVDELEAKLELAMQAHVEIAPNGVPYISPSRYDALRQYIVEDLALWAQAAHAKRAKPATEQQALQQAALDRARVEAQKAKREIGKQLKPVGRAGEVKLSPKAEANPSTVDDAVRMALNSAMASFRQ